MLPHFWRLCIRTTLAASSCFYYLAFFAHNTWLSKSKQRKNLSSSQPKSAMPNFRLQTSQLINKHAVFAKSRGICWRGPRGLVRKAGLPAVRQKAGAAAPAPFLSSCVM